jgi:phosphoglycerol transferase MdoB-like AlkP superfamily enzyme
MLTTFWQQLSPAGPFAPLLMLAIIGLLALTLARLALMAWQWQRVSATGLRTQIVLQGIRVDIIQLALLCVLPVLLSPLAAIPALWQAWQQFSYYWVIGGITLLLFLEAAAPGFIAEYDVRPNRLFVEYLKYPREVFSMLWKGFRVHVLGGLLAVALSIWLMGELMQPWLVVAENWRWWAILLAWPMLLVLLTLAIRSSTGHRPANPAMFAISNDAMVNSLILNSAWSVLHAIYSLKHESKTSEAYGRMPMEEVLEELRREREQAGVPSLPPVHNGSEELPSLNHLMPSRQRERPLNLVIILEESLGATFVESLGGMAVTPELERLKTQGWWFEQLYATGTRSVRGIEAVVCGFPPTPAQAAVKLSLSQQRFFSLADLLGRRGYHTEFIYGGESHFDNMNGFFRGNGFQRITDQHDFTDPIFCGSWGVSDEDLFNRAHENISALHAAGKPFFTLAFTSSNHSPFEFPDGRIELHEPRKATEANAVKYADHALGKFMDQARASAYWQDTLFMIVADHDIKVRGDSLVPVRNFHIPALLLGADLEPRRISRVCSQIDLPVTALSLMGIEADHPMPGRDLSRDNASDTEPAGRAIMQFEDNYAFMQGRQAAILRPGAKPVHALYDAAGKRLQMIDPAAPGAPLPIEAAALERRALANALLPSRLYAAQQYRLPDDSPAQR